MPPKGERGFEVADEPMLMEAVEDGGRALETNESLRGRVLQTQKTDLTQRTRHKHEIDLQASDPDPSVGLAWFYPENPWGSPPSWQKPRMKGRTFLALWDVVTFVACIYVSWAVPYKLGYLTVEDEPECMLTFDREAAMVRAEREGRPYSSFKADLELVIGWCDVFTDIFFVFDIVVSFHTARWVISTVGQPHWQLIETLPEIRRMYLRAMFIPDLIGVVPVQYIDCVFLPGSVPDEVKALHLVRLIKLLRAYMYISPRWLSGTLP